MCRSYSVVMNGWWRGRAEYCDLFFRNDLVVAFLILYHCFRSVSGMNWTISTYNFRQLKSLLGSVKISIINWILRITWHPSFSCLKPSKLCINKHTIPPQHTNLHAETTRTFSWNTAYKSGMGLFFVEENADMWWNFSHISVTPFSSRYECCNKMFGVHFLSTIEDCEIPFPHLICRKALQMFKRLQKASFPLFI